MMVAPSPEHRVDLARHRDDPGLVAFGDDANDAEIEIDLRPGQEDIAPAQACDDCEFAQLGEIDILDLVEFIFLVARDLAHMASLFLQPVLLPLGRPDDRCVPVVARAVHDAA